MINLALLTLRTAASRGGRGTLHKKETVKVSQEDKENLNYSEKGGGCCFSLIVKKEEKHSNREQMSHRIQRKRTYAHRVRGKQEFAKEDKNGTDLLLLA